MPEDGVGDLQDALNFGDFCLIKVELFDDVIALALGFDAIGQAALPPGGDLLDLTTIGLNQLANSLDLLLDRLIIKLRLDDVHELVGRQPVTSSPQVLAPLIA